MLPPTRDNSAQRANEAQHDQNELDEYAEGVNRAMRKEKLEAERATVVHNLVLEAVDRDRETHAVKMNKAYAQREASKDDLKDGAGDANKRALASGLDMSIRRAPGMEDIPLLGKAWVTTSQTEWASFILEEMFHGPGGIARWMTEHQLRFVPNLRLINGIAKTSLGGIGITPDDVSERVSRDTVGSMKCPVALKAGP